MKLSAGLWDRMGDAGLEDPFHAGVVRGGDTVTRLRPNGTPNVRRKAAC